MFASYALPTGDLAHTPGMYLYWESNRQPLVYRLVLNLLSPTNQVKGTTFKVSFPVLLRISKAIGYQKMIKN